MALGQLQQRTSKVPPHPTQAQLRRNFLQIFCILQFTGPLNMFVSLLFYATFYIEPLKNTVLIKKVLNQPFVFRKEHIKMFYMMSN